MALALSVPAAVFAGDFKYSMSVVAADYLDSDYKPGKVDENHFTGVTGPFSGAKAAVDLVATYTLPTPLGSHWLLSDANVEFRGDVEISPLSLRPMLDVTFTPLPFLVFSAGGSIGTGWNPLGFDGMSVYNKVKHEYEALTPFAHYYYDFWASATFQFDTGAIIKGDWTHVVMLATYKWIYKGITGVDNGDIWQWQVVPGEANGWQYYVTGVLGYKTPTILNMVGVMGEFYGHFDRSDFGTFGKNYDGEFMWIDLSLLMTFGLNKTNSLTALFTFESNRSFATPHKDVAEEPFLIKTGREWSFYRIALNWKHEF